MATVGQQYGGPLQNPQGFGGQMQSQVPQQWQNPNNGPRPGGMPGSTPQPSSQPPAYQSPWAWNGGQNPWAQNVTATQNGISQAWATPSNPNVNYITPEAAQAVAKMFGANVVQQNTQGMSSPGSGAPSAPIQGLDFGIGDPQNAGQVAFWLQRGDSPQEIAKRLAAGIAPNSFPGAAPGMPASWAWNGLGDRSQGSPQGIGLQAFRDWQARLGQ